MASEELSDMTKKELMDMASDMGLSTKGTKVDLIARILDGAPEEAPAEAPAEEVVEEVVEEAPVEEAPVEEAPAPKKAKKSGSLPSIEEDDLSAEEFVKAAYLAILKRDADPAGLRHYCNLLNIHKTMSRQQILDDLSNSAEAKSL